MFKIFCRAALVLCFLGLVGVSNTARAENWPGWRGPRADGTSAEQGVPTRWDAANLAWKTAVPGVGHASPIVWGDRIFTVTAFPEKGERVLVCFGRKAGNILWQETVVSGPLEKLHRENSYASSTPATDGQRVFAVFRVGAEVVVAAHNAADGKQLWLKRPGTHTGEWGFSNEPVLFEDKVIVDADSKGDSFLIALSREDGRTLWRVDRTRAGISYSAPFIREMAGRMQLIQCGDRSVTSFDPRTGRLLWTVDGPSQEFVATPCYSEKTGLVYVSSSWPERHLLAIRPDGRGDVTRTHIVWRTTRGAPYVPSPLIADDFLLTINDAGVAFCYEAATGKVLWEERLSRHHASPVLIGGLAVTIDDKGVINVIRPGRTFARLDRYELGESCYTSPALSDGQVFLRGFTHLFCFGQGTPRLRGLMADSPVIFPKEGALPAKYPPDVKAASEPAEKDYYIFASPCRSLPQIAAIQNEMPPGRFTSPPPGWTHLRRTRRTLTEGGDLRFLALGDSIVNDTMRSGWLAQLQEAYPKARIQATVYVRGGGGCQHYKDDNRVTKYILPRQPDLVFIGGISQKDIPSIRAVIDQLRAGLPNVEILLATGSFGTVDPRDLEALAKAPHSGTGAYGNALKALAEEERCAYLDMTGPWAEYIRSAAVHPHLFYRDVVHANEFGEQILAKIMMAFWSAEEAEP